MRRCIKLKHWRQSGTLQVGVCWLVLVCVCVVDLVQYACTHALILPPPPSLPPPIRSNLF
jgi:hypothetical protein